MSTAEAQHPVITCLEAEAPEVMEKYLPLTEPGTVLRATDTGREWVRAQQYYWATIR